MTSMLQVQMLLCLSANDIHVFGTGVTYPSLCWWHITGTGVTVSDVTACALMLQGGKMETADTDWQCDTDVC